MSTGFTYATHVCMLQVDVHLVCYTSHDANLVAGHDANLVAGAACAGAYVSLCRLHHDDATLQAEAPSQLAGRSSGGAGDGFTLRVLQLHYAT